MRRKEERSLDEDLLIVWDTTFHITSGRCCKPFSNISFLVLFDEIFRFIKFITFSQFDLLARQMAEKVSHTYTSESQIEFFCDEFFSSLVFVRWMIVVLSTLWVMSFGIG